METKPKLSLGEPSGLTRKELYDAIYDLGAKEQAHFLFELLERTLTALLKKQDSGTPTREFLSKFGAAVRDLERRIPYINPHLGLTSTTSSPPTEEKVRALPGAGNALPGLSLLYSVQIWNFIKNVLLVRALDPIQNQVFITQLSGTEQLSKVTQPHYDLVDSIERLATGPSISSCERVQSTRSRVCRTETDRALWSQVPRQQQQLAGRRPEQGGDTPSEGCCG